MDISIPALFNSCFNALKIICSRIERESTSDTDLLHFSRWQDELGRLRLWAANIGVHRTGQSSLEFRLKESSHIREQVTNLLRDLGQMLQEVEEGLDLLGNGHASQIEADNSSDDDYDTGEELTQLHSNIVTVINCLFQMSMLVRNPARHDFYMSPQSQEVLAFRPFDQAHVREKYPEADQGLVERLGLAMTLRRQHLRNRGRHHAKPNQGLDVGTEGSAAPAFVLSDTIVTDVEPWHIESKDNAPASEKSQTSYAPSMLAGSELVIPSPPKESSGRAPFECPYCAVIITVDGTSAWHKHVFQDLQPYVCTVAACSTPHTLFSKRHEWVQHLKEAHPREWTGDEKIAGAAINGSDISSFCANCPLCRSNSKSEKHFVRHLARHLQELALFVLPQDEAYSGIYDGPDPVLFGKSISESSVSSTVSTNPEHESSHDEQQSLDRRGDRFKSAAIVEAQERARREGQGERLDHEREWLRGQLERTEQEPSRDRLKRMGIVSLEPSSLEEERRSRRLRNPRFEAPYAKRSEASRRSRPRLNEFFVDGAGIHREVMQREICKLLGPEAYSKPHSYNGMQGYLVSAIRPFTPDQLDDLQKLSEAYESENRQKEKRGYPGIPYENSEVHRRHNANLKPSDDADMMDDVYYPRQFTPLDSTREPGKSQQQPQGSISSSAADLRLGYPYDPRLSQRHSYSSAADPGSFYSYAPQQPQGSSYSSTADLGPGYPDAIPAGSKKRPRED